MIKKKKLKKKRKTNLESKFECILKLLSIKYKFQYLLDGYNFDFYLIKYNVLIEVDGDFHHCNPKTIYAEAKHPIQVNSVTNDRIKDSVAKKNNIKLLRFWESDINNEPEKIVKKLRLLN